MQAGGVFIRRCEFILTYGLHSKLWGIKSRMIKAEGYDCISMLCQKYILSQKESGIDSPPGVTAGADLIACRVLLFLSN
jgi:hypothetical protein